MTRDREFKDRVRARMAKTGESYATARARLDTRGGLPPVRAVRPVFRIESWEAARPHYVDALGFAVGWEWRHDPHSPAIVAVGRDGFGLMLVESDEHAGQSWVAVDVADLHALAAEWNERVEGSAEVLTEPPYDIPTVITTDPSGNRISWEEPVSAAEQRARQERAELMRAIIRDRLEAGDGLPTADELVAEVGRPLGVALEVLNEFPEWEAVTRPT